MQRKDHIDTFGAIALTGFSLLLAFNQVVIKVTTGGLPPVFFAGLRSAGAVLCVLLWMRLRGIPLDLGARPVRIAGLLAGIGFSVEFICLFVALDLTTVGRSSVIFYSMPVWMALGAHVLIPGERLTRRKVAGLAFALAGVSVALLNRGDGQASLLGDMAALGAAMTWAAVGLLAKVSPLRLARPEMQLMWQVAISAPVLLLLAPLFGDLLRDVQPIHLWGLAFQIVIGGVRVLAVAVVYLPVGRCRLVQFPGPGLWRGAGMAFAGRGCGSGADSGPVPCGVGHRVDKPPFPELIAALKMVRHQGEPVIDGKACH